MGHLKDWILHAHVFQKRSKSKCDEQNAKADREGLGTNTKECRHNSPTTNPAEGALTEAINERAIDAHGERLMVHEEVANSPFCPYCEEHAVAQGLQDKILHPHVKNENPHVEGRFYRARSSPEHINEKSPREGLCVQEKESWFDKLILATLPRTKGGVKNLRQKQGKQGGKANQQTTRAKRTIVQQAYSQPFGIDHSDIPFIDDEAEQVVGTVPVHLVGMDAADRVVVKAKSTPIIAMTHQSSLSKRNPAVRSIVREACVTTTSCTTLDPMSPVKDTSAVRAASEDLNDQSVPDQSKAGKNDAVQMCASPMQENAALPVIPSTDDAVVQAEQRTSSAPQNLGEQILSNDTAEEQVSVLERETSTESDQQPDKTDSNCDLLDILREMNNADTEYDAEDPWDNAIREQISINEQRHADEKFHQCIDAAVRQMYFGQRLLPPPDKRRSWNKCIHLSLLRRANSHQEKRDNSCRMPLHRSCSDARPSDKVKC